MIHAVNQYGNKVTLPGQHPRKELLEKLGEKSAVKMYRDKTNGETVHCGYIVRGSWYTLYNVTPWEQKA